MALICICSCVSCCVRKRRARSHGYVVIQSYETQPVYGSLPNQPTQAYDYRVRSCKRKCKSQIFFIPIALIMVPRSLVIYIYIFLINFSPFLILSLKFLAFSTQYANVINIDRYRLHHTHQNEEWKKNRKLLAHHLSLRSPYR